MYTLSGALCVILTNLLNSIPKIKEIISMGYWYFSLTFVYYFILCGIFYVPYCHYKGLDLLHGIDHSSYITLFSYILGVVFWLVATIVISYLILACVYTLGEDRALRCSMRYKSKR